jgi:hypothetical protein
MKQVRICECCGHPLPGDDVEALLTPTQRKMYISVKAAGRSGITNPGLMQKIYADRFDGGPEYTSVIAVMAKSIRTKLAPHGLTIRSTGGPGARYFLEILK